MFIVAKYKNLTNTAKYIYIYIKLHTWPSIESNEITVSFREEEIKNFPSRVSSTSFLPSILSFLLCLLSISMNTSIETRRNIGVVGQRYRRAEFPSNEAWPIVEFCLNFPSLVLPFPLFYRVSRRVRTTLPARPRVQSSNINFKVGGTE